MQETLLSLSKELGLPVEVIMGYYKANWLYIKTTIENLPLKDGIEEEEYNKLRVSFNLPNLGKLACSYNRYLGVRKKCELIKEQAKKDGRK